MHDPEGIKALLEELKARTGSWARLARRLEVDERLVRMWSKKTGEELLRIQPRHLDQLKKCAQDFGLEPQLYDRPPKLWNPNESYEANLASDPAPPPVSATHFRNHHINFLGHTLRSPFGASASVLTAKSSRIRFLAASGSDVVTYKTVRSSEYRRHPGPNLFYCPPDSPHLGPEDQVSGILVGDLEEGCSPAYGMMNRFGMPSPPVEVWQADFQHAKGTLATGQLLILSVAGTAGSNRKQTALVDDFARVVELAIEAGADVIELNLSCPNCQGREGLTYQDLRLSVAICRAVNALGGTAKVLAKIGFMGDAELRTFILETASYVDGYSAINSLPAEGLRQGQRDAEPAFFVEGLKAGLSGRPILRLGLHCVSALVRTCQEEGLERLGIIGMGGISTPDDVKLYLDCGAHVVQATTAFFHDSLFAVKVRKFLDVQLPADITATMQDREEAARMAWLRAVEQLESEEPRLEHLAQIATLEWLGWLRAHREETALGKRRTPEPNTPYFIDRLRQQLR